MLTVNSKHGRLTSAAEAAGLKQTKQGRFGIGKKKADWSIKIGPSGRFTVTRRWDNPDDDLLEKHAAWRGPVKLQRKDGAIIQQLDVYLGQLLAEEQCMTRDDQEQAIVDQLLVDLLSAVPNWLAGVDEIAGWSPPSAETVSNWLVAAGHECAIDNEGNLRLALKRRGCDGQIRVERTEGRLRFSMLLGEWRALEQPVTQALFDLADEANARSQLVRISFTPGDENRLRCEAQVDLSGLPHTELLEDAGKTMWGEMIRATMDGLHLVLRRLGLELNSLADPDNRKLAEAYNIDW